MSKKSMSRLYELSGSVKPEDRANNPHTNVLRSPSPSMNFSFGNGHGLPFGHSLVIYAPAGAGKSLIANAFAGQLHRDDPDAVVLKFNTEGRDILQLSPKQMANYGIDENRYLAFQGNDPTNIFDRIEKDIAAEIQEGLQVKLIIIDSVNGIKGRRAKNADSIDVQNIGDHALTIKEGVKRIADMQRENKIAFIFTCHVTAEMDRLEQMRGNTYKMSAGNGLMHHCEYFLLAEQNKGKAGRQDLLGNNLVNEGSTDLMDNPDRTGHKIRVCMKKSSLGPAGRVGEFTFDYHRGMVNIHEEVFQLGMNRGAIVRAGNTYNVVGSNEEFKSKPAFLEALKNRDDLQAMVVNKVKADDFNGVVVVSTKEED